MTIKIALKITSTLNSGMYHFSVPLRANQCYEITVFSHIDTDGFKVN